MGTSPLLNSSQYASSSDPLLPRLPNLTNHTQHLTSYPVISDTISAYQSNYYGAKSIDLVDYAHSHYIDPVLESKQGKQAQSYIHPYAAKADSLGEEGLKRVETHFPLIKEDTATVRETVISFILTPVTLPLSYARWGYDWLNETYANEVKSAGGEKAGLIAQGKALVSTGLVVVGESASWVREMLAKAKKESEEKAEEAKDEASKKGQEAKEEVNGST